MEQVGEVFEVNDDGMAKIIVKKHSSCKSCGGCGILSAGGGTEVTIEVPNPVGAKVGEFVRIGVETNKVILASLIVYVIPVIALVIAMFITQKVAIGSGYQETAEVMSIGVGFLAMVLVFVVIRLMDKRIAQTRKFKPTITEIIPEDQLEACLVEYNGEKE
ncbi:SoxR reducing system RseC family protein [Candidatus Contubernalis alkaliaceticus]|uniref:SoxR reducing system RseC family protein n=1 Tax=Candidatus Contubernalis alkaliaceticus TaxID=338645 RepID=UPI001F4BEA0F|nr:SoxR reducing system RseC family protein [Candidatus Contubernalis alkalaceticus]UNC92943.1 SoxR reducing system RseC family protein [Candidatus Contubernalis alkalaceticus]